jgi:hypothetical protein
VPGGYRTPAKRTGLAGGLAEFGVFHHFCGKIATNGPFLDQNRGI